MIENNNNMCHQFPPVFDLLYLLSINILHLLNIHFFYFSISKKVDISSKFSLFILLQSESPKMPGWNSLTGQNRMLTVNIFCKTCQAAQIQSAFTKEWGS